MGMHAEAQRRGEKIMVRRSKGNPALRMGYDLACHRKERSGNAMQNIFTGLHYGNHFRAARINNGTRIITMSCLRLCLSAFQK
jgi:hypothetical protein